MCRWNNIKHKDMTLLKSETVRTLANMYNTYKFHDGHTETDANIIFHRLVVLAQQQASVAERFAYEVTPYPAALFKDGFICKPVESNVYCGQTAGWIRILLGTVVCLGPINTVLNEDPAPPPRKESQQPPPLFASCLLWPKGRPSQQLLSSCHLSENPRWWLLQSGIYIFQNYVFYEMSSLDWPMKTHCCK